jgi:predicted DNA-binding transcriptional regulator AlpA|tara:strand:+ start:827 stop:1036 length:210 start_codon:yes stop_codon:yes gene_type:complete
MDKYLNIDDIAESLKIKKSTVLQWVRDGKFPPPMNSDDRVPIWSLVVIEDWIGQQQFTNEMMHNQDVDF